LNPPPRHAVARYNDPGTLIPFAALAALRQVLSIPISISIGIRVEGSSSFARFASFALILPPPAAEGRPTTV